MTEEEFFRKNYPDSCYGDRPLSPHWDFFQDGVAFGEQQSEKKIAELKDKLANADYQLEGRDNEIRELEEETEKMRDCLKRWYEQKSEKFTETFYEKLMRDTEKYLWNEGVEG